MPRFAANLSMLYPERPFLDRFESAARDGFEGVEFLFPYEHAPEEIAARLRGNGLQQVLFNAPPGDFANGERGMACLPGREAQFQAGLLQAMRYAQALGCPRVHVMAGLVPAHADRAALRATYIANLRWAAKQAEREGVNLLVEPINVRDIPGYFLNRQDDAHAVLAEVGAGNVKVQMDLYHCQIVEGDVATKIRQYLPTGRVAHFQIAGVPQRHEPDLGEVNFDYLFGVIDEVSATCGWEGWIGCEYRPARGAAEGGTSEGLGWLRRWRTRTGA
ncbi:2-oxo-tetronate isomerase [Ramlibacter humi]|uniref:Hydroxypyruvate isomerase family protein n=1 Tax=Ramlibacter humi TaxID=2530451 RepID=A0A4Z0BV88_9BURK|nr:2-oxo-tetronate isomerase [Ramlibacter humi]TFZ01935.1 hydroxypyruvate isomerase family protein [Ramlibacter humi]